MNNKKELVEALCEDFKYADKVIQDIKSVTRTEVIPAISQLRYAGWHLADWLKSDLEGNSDENEFLKITEHSKRAIFEASRFGIFFCMSSIQDFRDMYGGEIMPGVIEGFSKKMHDVEKSREFLISISDQEKDIRANTCYDHFVIVKGILQELISCQPELNKLKEQKQNEIETLKIRHKQQITVAVTAIVIAVIGIIVTALL